MHMCAFIPFNASLPIPKFQFQPTSSRRFFSQRHSVPSSPPCAFFPCCHFIAAFFLSMAFQPVSQAGSRQRVDEEKRQPVWIGWMEECRSMIVVPTAHPPLDWCSNKICGGTFFFSGKHYWMCFFWHMNFCTTKFYNIFSEFFPICSKSGITISKCF